MRIFVRSMQIDTSLEAASNLTSAKSNKDKKKKFSTTSWASSYFDTCITNFSPPSKLRAATKAVLAKKKKIKKIFCFIVDSKFTISVTSWRGPRLAQRRPESIRLSRNSLGKASQRPSKFKFASPNTRDSANSRSRSP